MTYKYKFNVDICTETPGNKIIPGTKLEQPRNEGFTKEVMEYIWNFMKLDLADNMGADGWTTTAMLYINDRLVRAFRLQLFSEMDPVHILRYRFQTTGMKEEDAFVWETLREGSWVE